MIMLTRDQITDILKEAGVLLEGHFLLTSGKHSNKYLQCAKIFRNTKYSETLCGELAEQFADAGMIRETKAQGRRRSYIITEKGREALEQENARMRTMLADYRRFMEGEKDA